MVGGGGNSAPLFYCGDELNFHNTVRYGDALEVLKTLPPGIVQCCITSPPYWGLRDYSVAGQFGLEATPDGNAHVLPKSLMEDLIEGRREIEDVDDWKIIIRAIIGEWLRHLDQ